MVSNSRHCWSRGKKHEWMRTGALRFMGGPFNRGFILRCLVCGHETATSNPALLRRAVDHSEVERDPSDLHV